MRSNRARCFAAWLSACVLALCSPAGRGQGVVVSEPLPVAPAPTTAPAAGPASAPAGGQPEPSVRFGEPRFFHGLPVRGLAFTADSKYVVAGGYQSGVTGDVSLWRLSDGKLARTVKVPAPGVYFIALPRKGGLGILVGTDRRLRSLDVEKGKLNDLRSRKAVSGSQVTLSPNGAVLAVPDGSNLSVEDARTGKRKFLVPRASAGAFSDDGVYLAVTSRSDVSFGVQLWDVVTGAKIRTFEALKGRRLSAPAFSRDGRFVAAGCFPGSANAATVWNAGTGRIVHKLPGGGRYVQSVLFAADGNTLIAVDRGSDLRRWDLEKGGILTALETDDRYLYTAALSPDGRWLVAGGMNGRIHVWDTRGFKRRRFAGCHNSPVYGLAACEGARLVATGGGAGLVVLWDGPTGRRLGELSAGPKAVASVAMSPGGEFVAACTREPIVRIWRAESRKPVRSPALGVGNAVWSRFTPHRRELVVVGEHGQSAKIDLRTGRASVLSAEPAPWFRPAKARVIGAPATTLRMAFAPDGYLAALWQRNPVSPWAIPTGRQFGPLLVAGTSMVYGVALSPRGRLMACDCGSRLVLIELDSARTVAETPNPRRRTTMGTGMEFSPDGSLLAMAEADGSVTLWSVRRWAKLGRREGVHRGQIASLGFTPDGRKLLTGGADGTGVLWDLADLLASDASQAGPKAMGQKELEECWRKLASEDARKANAAYYRLVSAGEAAAALLAEKLDPVASVKAGEITRLIEELGHHRFRVRQKATEALAQLGSLAEPALQEAAETGDVEEVRIRSRQLLAAMGDPTQRAGVALRQLRAALALEEIGTDAAADALKRLAGGSSDADLTRRAREALKRLGRPREGR